MEETYIINGGRKLSGEIEVEASKNAFLPVLAGSVLVDGEVEFLNTPEFSDIQNMCEILKVLNIKVNRSGKYLKLNTESIKNEKITHDLTNKLRASIFLLGPLLSKFKEASISYPGGCNIGTRPIDIHLSAFRSLGVKIAEKHGYIYCNAHNMKAGKVVFSSVSVGATESVMMSAIFLKGKTTLYNVAREPEIRELARFLNEMGAVVRGAGGDIIEIEGVKKLHGGTFSVFPDRIVAGTHLILGALCGRKMEIKGVRKEDNQLLLNILRESACEIEEKNDRMVISASEHIPACRFLETLPYPNFPTDLQPQFMVLESVANGTSVIKENLFENRFNHVMELVKMGADIFVKDRLAIVKGVERLYGADVSASDLRAGAGLVIAGLIADGYTTIHNLHYIDRGYERLEEKLKLLGADIKRVKIE